MKKLLILTLCIYACLNVYGDTENISPFKGEVYQEKMEVLQRQIRLERIEALKNKAAAEKDENIVVFDPIEIRPFKSGTERFIEGWATDPYQFYTDEAWKDELKKREPLNRFLNSFSLPFFGISQVDLAKMFVRDRQIANELEHVRHLRAIWGEDDPAFDKRYETLRFDLLQMRRAAIPIKTFEQY